LGEFVLDYNDFTEYFGEVMHGIGRLRDLLGAGAPEAPTDLTAVQKRALRPTNDTEPSGGKKRAFREWRAVRAQYAEADSAEKGGLPAGPVFDVAGTGRNFNSARQGFWEAQGKLSRTIAAAKKLDPPKYQALELKLSDVVSLAGGGWGAVAFGVDAVFNAREKRNEYDRKMQEFRNALKDTNDAVRDEFEAFRGAGANYWAKMTDHRVAIQKREKARIESRKTAGDLGQAMADHSETRNAVLAEVRMPALVSDAWHALASIGPAARKKLLDVLAGRLVVENVSRTNLAWRGHDPLALEDVTQLRLAWQKAKSWEFLLGKDDIEEWVAMNKQWEETWLRFDV
jgi:hypothetical protein